jgi:oligoendopeptidase F
MRVRSEVSPQDRWNVEALYPTASEWEEAFQKITLPHAQLDSFKGTFVKGAETLRLFLDLFFECDRAISRLYTYAYLRHDENLTDDANKKNFERILKLCFDFRQEFSWVEPEILALPDQKLKDYLHSEELKPYCVYLKKIVRLKSHTLSEKEEELMALCATPLGTSGKAFSAFNNADLKFGKVTDSKGEELPLSHGTYSLYLRSFDRTLRKAAFQATHRQYLHFENTLTELLNGHVQRHLFEAKARGYSSCLEAALFPYNIDVSVYHSLIATVRKNLPVLHRYVHLRKKVLNLSELHLFDFYVPLVKEVEFSMSYEEAANVVIDSVGALGKEYQQDLRKGFLEERWVDRYENTGKRSGAYSGGCYDSYPYILMNFNGSINDVRTLAHEAGHSMHSLLSKRHQPYVYADYPIFVAEVASTFNEELLTLFRQTMFAEFELFIHECAEKGIPITPTLLKEQYRKLNADYFGPEVVIDEEIEVEPLRIPHFYSNFYVYQYATGICAALALAQGVKKKGEEARKKYLAFLASGSTLDSLDLLQLAGVDMRSSEPIQQALDYFNDLVVSLESLKNT